jgi:hypothetical protein
MVALKYLSGAEGSKVIQKTEVKSRNKISFTSGLLLYFFVFSEQEGSLFKKILDCNCRGLYNGGKKNAKEFFGQGQGRFTESSLLQKIFRRRLIPLIY